MKSIPLANEEYRTPQIREREKNIFEVIKHSVMFYRHIQFSLLFSIIFHACFLQGLKFKVFLLFLGCHPKVEIPVYPTF